MDERQTILNFIGAIYGASMLGPMHWNFLILFIMDKGRTKEEAEALVKWISVQNIVLIQECINTALKFYEDKYIVHKLYDKNKQLIKIF